MHCSKGLIFKNGAVLCSIKPGFCIPLTAKNNVITDFTFTKSFHTLCRPVVATVGSMLDSPRYPKT